MVKKRKRLGVPKEQKMQTVRLLAEPNNRLVGKDSLGKPDDSLTVSKEIKQGLLHIFRDSKGMGIFMCYLNYKLPSIHRAYYERIGVISVSPEGIYTVLDDRGFYEILRHMEKNFKWAAELIAKIIPKDMAAFGSLKDDQTLTGMVRKVTKQAKTIKTKELIEGLREKEILEFKQTETEEVTEYETSGTDGN